tara:strand:- start:340 stop:708 length:369 start_codon:yes stop_codon:yes gene_type:complete
MDISDNNIISILRNCNIDICQNDINGILIERDPLLSEVVYDKMGDTISKLKKNYSSSRLTSLQKTAKKEQKWPLLNLVRQLLKAQNYTMVPIRKADGYTEGGKKLYKRYFNIVKMNKEVNAI